MANPSSNSRVHLPDDILPRLRARDESAYRQLIDLAFTPLARFANEFVNSYDQAEDIVQDVLVKIFEKGRDFSPGDSLITYLFAAVRNRCLNVIRDRGVAQKYNATIAIETGLSNSADVTDPTNIDHLVKNLTEQQRTAVNLRYVEQLSMAEIASVLGVTVSAAEKLLARALKSLKDSFPRSM